MQIEINPDERSTNSVRIDVPRISSEEYVQTEIIAHHKTVNAGGFLWRQVRPCFYRPAIYFQKFNPKDVRIPVFGRIGGVQYALTDEERNQGNSTINYWAFRDLENYSLRDLNSESRRKLSLSLKKFELRQINSPEELSGAHGAYVSFHDRTGYGVRTDRRDEKMFSRWSEEIFESPSLVLGAYQDGKLSGVTISRIVDGFMINSTYFAHDDAVKNHVSDLFMHVRRQIAKAEGSIREIVLSPFYNGSNDGLDNFYRARKAELVQLPARFDVNPVAGFVLRKFAPRQFKKLEGRIDSK